ncbi:MerR family transcriptional regulator [Brevibacterium casei]|uniref:DNA-binding transcriptional regulator, MerR family n=1 Tax=Brevibacterium casei CIP 102111 TaxID=1255625 RepID=A0A2H1HMF8_9MICO|nr:MerR family transcriptional regulator [Brevibacterium casei]MCT1765567.1 MerR family transcriptional regulator [Brevibacterium casei]MCT2357771.1 MerR family transcriptional regulator [Brevibacterium casei]SMX64051.1 DNA-binding transcriptional regulator, MerR family [Brevibacterium casei CIP 102111]
MRIGEVSRRSGVSARMLRHYETLGLVTPSARGSNGYREYSPSDIGRIFHIEGLRRLGLSLPEVGRLLAEPGFDASALVTDLIAAAHERIETERRLLDRLEEIRRLGYTDGESLLGAIDLMRSLESRDVIQRHKAALGSGVDGGVPVESLSRAVLDEAVPNAAGAMRWALAQVGTDAVVPLSTGLRSAEPAVRRNAIRALDEIRRTASADDVAVATAVAVPMQEALDDDDLEVRTVAALALGDMRDPVAVPILLEVAMSDEKDIDAAEALASYFAEVPPAGGANAPSRDEVEVPVDGVEVPVVDGAGAATGEDTGEPTGDSVGASIMAALRERLRSSDAHVRFRVLQVLIEIPDPQAEALLTGLTHDAEQEIAETAKAALRRRRRTSAETGRHR